MMKIVVGNRQKRGKNYSSLQFFRDCITTYLLLFQPFTFSDIVST